MSLRPTGSQAVQAIFSFSHYLSRHVDGQNSPLDAIKRLKHPLSDRGLACPHQADEEYRVLVGDEGGDEIVVTHGVHGGYNNLIEGGSGERTDSVKRGGGMALVTLWTPGPQLSGSHPSTKGNIGCWLQMLLQLIKQSRPFRCGCHSPTKDIGLNA